ncbi:MAG: T9SS type A sorting domain-containing protein [Bacteroidota bacterium]
MKKFFLPIFILLLLAGSTTISAQHRHTGLCGTKDQHLIKERLMYNRAHPPAFAEVRGGTTYVPVKLHLVARSDGTGRVNTVDVLDMMCLVNEIYRDQNIQFYIRDGFRNLNQSAIYNTPNVQSGIQQIQSNKVNNAINIFITGSTGTNGTLAYYQGGAQLDYIVADQRYIRSPSVMPHELGHFFSLAHPFYGWEGNPYNPSVHGNPVGDFAPSDPSQIGNVGLIPAERQDRSNCTQAADGICDTPPDYLFAFTQNGCANYNGGAMDPNGDMVDPMENNIMSYFEDCDDYIFTNDQKTAIRADLFSVFRNYVRPNYTPDLTVLDATNLTSPIDGEIWDEYTSVTLDWEAQPGAVSYIVQIDRFRNFAFQPQQFVVNDPFLVLNNLDPNRTYYWRVRPFGELVTCTEFTEAANFRTGDGAVSTKDIDYVKGWMVRPNPLRSDQSLTIAVDADQSFEADVQLFNLTGQLIHQVNSHRFTSGQSILEMPSLKLGAGMYIVAIRTEDAVSNKKFVVSD